MSFSWNQVICESCWDARNPGRGAVAMTEAQREAETCAYCGIMTRSGIYVRDDPANVRYPQVKE